jgi:hypothetical protein
MEIDFKAALILADRLLVDYEGVTISWVLDHATHTDLTAEQQAQLRAALDASELA